MERACAPVVIDAKYKLVKPSQLNHDSIDSKTDLLSRACAKTGGDWVVLIMAVNASLLVHIVMKYYLDWG
jgi:hypothetical protein